MIKLPSKIEKIYPYTLTDGNNTIFQINLFKRKYLFNLKKNRLEGKLIYDSELILEESKYITNLNNKILQYMRRTKTNNIHLTPKPENNHDLGNKGLKYIKNELSDCINCSFKKDKLVLEMSIN